MNNLTEQQKNRLITLSKVIKKGDMALLEHMFQIEEILEKKLNRDEIKALLPHVRDGKTPSEDELREIIQPLIPEPIKGDSYVLTENDKNEIAQKIQVPIVDRIIERRTEVQKIEVIKEQPIVTQFIKEVAVADSADTIRNKLELLQGDERLDAKAIKGLEPLQKIDDIERIAKLNAFNPTMGPSFADLAAINSRIDNLPSNPSSGLSLLTPTSGLVNGTNQTFTFSKAPQVLFTENGWFPRQNNGVSDTTINWTGTNPITFNTEKPNSFCFAFG